ncbi:class I SAM-dependent methyltransferase [Nitrobacter sp. TKz-YC01]|uniref:class I SAM-dependent methyltransferase n=1 Tax=Nitrobacter sp. TKz-YC01 TaxID=3398703 RepID=UPI003A0FBE93
MKAVEQVPCPCCGSEDFSPWADELGFFAVRCHGCALIYVNPRPLTAQIDSAVRTGVHGEDATYLDVRTRRVSAKIDLYRTVFDKMFVDVWRGGKPISWLDIGAGNGEIVEAISAIAPAGSQIGGVEPMEAKAARARARGLKVVTSYLAPDHPKVDFVSIVDVFSHVPEFHDFLATVRSVLNPHGELFLETGNLADLDQRDDFPGELGLPDHLVFAGEKQIGMYLSRAGFEIVAIQRVRVDDIIYFAKSMVKRMLGRPCTIRLPYTSKYRQIRLRARLVA